MRAGEAGVLGLVLLFILICPTGSDAQQFRFTNHRELAVPGYATFKLGPFFSTVAFSQSVAYRYTRSSGTGTDYLVQNRRGVIVRDGHELPCVSTLEMRNYLLLTDNTDLDISIRLVYEYYPLETQEDDFYVDMGQEGVVGSLSSEIVFSQYLRGTVSDSVLYRTDYIDTRGIPDRYGGQRYEYLQNTVGMDLDWLFAKNMNLGITLSRSDNIPFTDTFLSQERVTYRESLVYEQAIAPGVVLGARAKLAQTRYRDPEETAVNLQDYGVFVNLERGARARITRNTTIIVGAGYSAGSSWPSAQTNSVETEGLFGLIELKTELTPRLSHTLSYQRLMRPGFLTGSLEWLDRYGYLLNWRGDGLSLELFSTFVVYKPIGVIDYGEYWDWSSGIRANYALTRYVTLDASSVYSLRDNRNDAAGPTLDPELTSDYDTWVSRLGTSVALTRELSFDTHAQYVERFSDNRDLACNRFTFYAGLRYRHEF